MTTGLAALPAEGWPRLRAGVGTKGLRWSEWRWLPLAQPIRPAWRRWLLVRRRVSDPTDLTAYVVLAPHASALEAVVRVAGSRGTVESCCEAAKGEVGLDQLSLSRLNHGQPGVQAHPEIVQGTAELHHEIADALLPQPDPVFHNATTLHTAVDMLNPQSAVVERLVGQVLLQGQLRAAGLLRRHEDRHLGGA